MRRSRVLLAAAAAVAVLAACASAPSSRPMGFFVTSVGLGKGGDLGGLAGADAHCQKLAALASAGDREWRAYLSVPGTFPQGATPGQPSIHARDRIGTGPWYNAKGELIARDVADLHDGSNGITKQTALDERGNVLNGRGDNPNQHDILTGTREDGTAFSPASDTTCKAWTSSTDGSAVVGHHDRVGPLPEPWAQSWSFSHQTPGCSPQALASVGGAGRFYCFAAK